MDRIPHQMRLGSGTALVVVPGKAPLCLRCRNTGHICRDCRVTRCAGCRAFGHGRVDDREMDTPKEDTDENTVMSTPPQRRSTRMETQRKPEPVLGPDAILDIGTVETTPVKRRLNEGDAASQQRPT
ncbi:hypothetical protein HPB51_020846 [Rhipicephalus microplus]|uniref:CCHC-type domain-containing protein n=1 Tax=Rhipicephalus microplus TaxID=6941 RepID=A0A9J6EBT7_RHIMP|nr:hypothetical protein HPB51_020846 [Rhipicephalus microplus]